MFWPKGGCLAYNSTNFISISTNFFNLFHNALYMTWITPSFNCMYPWCMCTHLIDPISIHLLCCAHGNESIKTHDAIYNTFAAIAQDAGFNVRWKLLHALPCSCQYQISSFTSITNGQLVTFHFKTFVLGLHTKKQNHFKYNLDIHSKFCIVPLQLAFAIPSKFPPKHKASLP